MTISINRYFNKDALRDYRKLIFSFIVIAIPVIILQHLSSLHFLKNELIYLAAPYYDFEGIAKSIVFLLSYLSSVFFIWLCIFIKSRNLWLVMLLFLFLFNWVDIFIQLAVNARGFTKYEYSIALLEVNGYKNMLIYLNEIFFSFLYSLSLILVLIACRKVIKKSIPTPLFIFFIVSVFFIVYGSKGWVYYIKYPSYPAIVKSPLIILEHHMNSVEIKPRILDDNIKPNILNENNKNIIWIIDESIGGKYLSLNGYPRDTTPYLKSLMGTGVISNFGIVNSVANCSAFSNLMMRIGLSAYTKNAETNYISTRMKLPTIYQYAKRAGYKTFLFDSQADEGQLQNYLTPYDMKDIDEFVTLDTRTEDYARDEVHLEGISKALSVNKEQKKFVIFVKDGAHWPYLWRYPKNKEIFSPVQDNVYEEKTVKNKDKLINTYLNVIRHTVDDFFIKFMKNIDVEETITFYTSDHGQNLLEEGANTPLTHCTTMVDAPKSQAEVPLFILGKDAAKNFSVHKELVYSQYQIFPTILSLMGYDKNVTSDYGDTLHVGKPKGTKRWFYWSREGHRTLFDNIKSGLK